MKVELIRQKVAAKGFKVNGKVFSEKPIASFTISQGEKRKLVREIDELNSIFAGGKMNPRYKLVTL